MFVTNQSFAFEDFLTIELFKFNNNNSYESVSYYLHGIADHSLVLFQRNCLKYFNYTYVLDIPQHFKAGIHLVQSEYL